MLPVMQINCGWKIAEGDPRDEICKEVLRICPDVLIVGSRGMSLLKRWEFVFPSTLVASL